VRNTCDTGESVDKAREGGARFNQFSNYSGFIPRRLCGRTNPS
jgi:hypothetical protein